MALCSYCNEPTDSLPYACKFCGGEFCSQHRLPEAHECGGLKQWKEQKEKKPSGWVYEPFRDQKKGSRTVPKIKISDAMLKAGIIIFLAAVLGIFVAFSWLIG